MQGFGAWLAAMSFDQWSGKWPGQALSAGLEVECPVPIHRDPASTGLGQLHAAVTGAERPP
jgi:hypothetical protein